MASNPLRIVVMGSTNGTDLQAIIDAIAKKELAAEICLVVSNKKDAYILTRAKDNAIPTYHIDYTLHKNREEAEAEIVQQICAVGDAQVIILIGWMKILTPYLVGKYEGRIWNVHPSLLPKYAGGMDLDVHKTVLENKEIESGCTLHQVSDKVDAGAIIMQKTVAIEPGETPQSLKTKVQEAEQRCLVEALQKVSRGELKLGGSQ